MSNNIEKNIRQYVQEVCEETIKKGPQEISFADKTFQDFLKEHRINKSSFGKIIGVSGSTINKYYNDPMLLKVSQVYYLSLECNKDVRILIDLILERNKYGY
tara:strand:+ start:1493 stop:1798 length:306 start_codon:yes stop_codon:yes gene_type:complete